MEAPQRFVNAHPLNELGLDENGNTIEGLTSRDMAEALGVRHDNIVQKLNRIDLNQLNDEGFNLTVHTVKLSSGAGRPRKYYVMDTDTAKLVLVQWSSKLSRAYFRYLLECERMVERGIPKLKAELEAAMKAAVKNKKIRRKGNLLVKVEAGMETVYDLWGNPHPKVIYQDKLYSELTDEELRLYQIRKRSNVMKGLAAKQDEAINGEHEKRLLQLKRQGTNVLILEGKKTDSSKGMTAV